MRAKVEWHYGAKAGLEHPVLRLYGIENPDAVLAWLKDRMGLDAVKAGALNKEIEIRAAHTEDREET